MAMMDVNNMIDIIDAIGVLHLQSVEYAWLRIKVLTCLEHLLLVLPQQLEEEQFVICCWG